MSNPNPIGHETRLAYDGPQFDQDKLIDFITARNREDGERASSAGESRQEIGEFVEETGINAKALSVLRTICKAADKKPEKALDMIRSLEKGIPMVKMHLTGNQSEMDLEPSDPPAPLDRDEEEQPAPVLSKQSYSEDPSFAGDPDLQADADAFEQHLADVAGGPDEK